MITLVHKYESASHVLQLFHMAAMTLVLAFLADISCKAQTTFNDGTLKYTVTSATDPLTVAVSGPVAGTGYTGPLTIPETVDYNGSTYSVTSIGNAAFHNCTKLVTENLILPSGLTSIGAWAFNNCPGLKGSITIPSGVVSIDDHAFNVCTGLTGSLTIPSSVISIGTYAFYGCTGFTGTLTISNGVKTIGDRAFQNTTFTGDLTIPNSVTSLGTIAAFCGCSKFNGSLTLSNQLATIGTATFQGCSSFTGTLTIPNSVVTIGDDAFNSCKGITGNLTIPSSVTTIGNNTFNACSGFNGTLTISDGVKAVGSSAFLNCTSMVKATIPNSVTSIGGAAFCGCGQMLVCFNEVFNGAIGGAALQGVKGVWFTDKTPGFNPSATAGVDIGIGTTYYIPEDDAASNAQTDATSIKMQYKAKISSTKNVIYRYYHSGLKTVSRSVAGKNTGVSTLYVNFPALVPDGLTAYYGKEVKSSSIVKIKSIDNTLNSSYTKPSICDAATHAINSAIPTDVSNTIIPTTCAVVLLGDVIDNVTVFEAATTSGAIEPSGTNVVTNNLLSGSLTDIATSSVIGGDVYTFGTGTNSHVVGFYPYTGTTLAAHKAYLLKTPSMLSKDNQYILSIDEEDNQATAISDIKDDGTAAKNTPYYNLQGIRVKTPTKGGIYIHNGKMIVIY